MTQLALWYRKRVAGGPALVLDTDDWEGFGGWNEYEAYPWWQKQVCDWQERWGLTHADAITAASRTLQTQAWSHRVPPEHVVYLPNGLAPEDYSGWERADGARGRAQLHLEAAAPVVVLYTRFFEFGPERAFAVLQQLVQSQPAVKLLVIGAGKFGQERRLERLARQRGLARHVVIAGWQPPDALPHLIAAGDVALFPAVDNLANRSKCSAKLLEALWLARPVVADRVGQNAEYVRDGVTGLTSDPDDPRTMAGAALRLLDDPAVAARLGAAGRAQVISEFNWRRLAGHAECAYDIALRRPGRRRPDEQ